MGTLKKSMLPTFTVLSLALSTIAGRSASAETITTPTSISSQTFTNYWRASAKKNFIEGFCVGQTLAAQQVIIQSNQQIDQATANALKGAIATCKANAKAQPVSSTPSQMTTTTALTPAAP